MARRTPRTGRGSGDGAAAKVAPTEGMEGASGAAPVEVAPLTQPPPTPLPAPPEPAEPSGPDVSRRRFLAYGGAAAAGLVLGGAVGYAAHQIPAASTAAGPRPPLQFLSEQEFAVVEAMAERIFPADPSGPGAKDARVASYIDGQLAGAWGRAERMYRQGPFLTPADTGHGYQYPMAPRDVYIQGLASLDAYCKRQYQKSFDLLNAKQQDETVQAMIDGKVDTFTTVPSATFFSMFRSNVNEGLFSDPIYGGNHDMIGWKHLGFPGSPMSQGYRYNEHIFKFQPYKLQPKGLQYPG